MQGMHPQEYLLMQEVEDSMWWYEGLHSNVIDAIRSTRRTSGKLLDAGCGTGGMLKVIKRHLPDLELYGTDISEQACEATRNRTGATVSQGSIDALAYGDQSFNVVISCDVLGYPIDVDAAVAGMYRILAPGGTLILNLAAYQWMLSYHDKAVGQVRRFNRKEAIALLRKHGFRIGFASYWNCFLFPLMVLKRKVLPDPGRSDVHRSHPLVEKLFATILATERIFLRNRIPLPFGGSLLIIAHRPSS
jgi:SAM-dependent methyltransferase